MNYLSFSSHYVSGKFSILFPGGNYCEFRTFNATCREDEVIVMESAKYGRMKIGDCVVADLGYVGCYKDVLDLVDRRCSGRRTCEIRVPDEMLTNTKPCLQELKMYLEASYSCLKGKFQPNLSYGEAYYIWYLLHFGETL